MEQFHIPYGRIFRCTRDRIKQRELRLGGTSGSHHPTLCSSRATQGWLPRTWPRWLLDISEDGDSSTCLGSPCQHPPPSEKVLPDGQGRPCDSVCAMCPWSWHWAPQSSAGSILSTPSLQGCYPLSTSLEPSLLQPAPPLCVSSPERCSSPLLFFVVLHRTLSSISMLGAQHWTQHSRSGIPSTERRGRIPSLLSTNADQDTIHLLHPKDTWSAPKVFSTELLSSWTVPGISQSSGIFLPRSRALQFPLLN